jgi:hypothetical protein
MLRYIILICASLFELVYAALFRVVRHCLMLSRVLFWAVYFL